MWPSWCSDGGSDSPRGGGPSWLEVVGAGGDGSSRALAGLLCFSRVEKQGELKCSQIGAEHPESKPSGGIARGPSSLDAGLEPSGAGRVVCSGLSPFPVHLGFGLLQNMGLFSGTSGSRGAGYP